MVEDADTTKKSGTRVFRVVVRANVRLLTQKLAYEMRKMGCVEFIAQCSNITRTALFLNAEVSF
jgi:hypothetical protein